MFNDNIEVSSNQETNAKTERLIHMSRYLEYLAMVQDFQAITGVRNYLNDDEAINYLISKMNTTTSYLNEVAQRHGVKNLLPQCIYNDIDDGCNMPIVEEYLRIRINAMKTAFIETCWVIDEMPLVDALGEIDKIIESFIDD